MDRNDLGLGVSGHGKGSLSARRAWIEISGVLAIQVLHEPSLSARRAWIEMVMAVVFSLTTVCRSPQGERG